MDRWKPDMKTIAVEFYNIVDAVVVLILSIVSALLSHRSNGFKFSKSKTQSVHFCQLHKQHDDPVLHLYGSPIPVVGESKFLGIIFDRKLSCIPHI